MVTWKIKLNKPIINLYMPNYLHVFLVISNESDKFQQTKQFVKQKVLNLTPAAFHALLEAFHAS